MAIRVLFDDKELSSQAIMSLSQSGQLFDNTFKLGSTLCRSVKLEVNSRYVSLPRPSVVYIYDDEEIKFTLCIDNVEKVDDFTYSYTLCDSMVKLNVALSDVFDWDTSSSYTVQTIVDNICDYIGSSHVTVDYIGDLSVSWDWDTMARDFLSYVAEINASYVYINASGNVTFVEHKNAPSHTLDVETCEDISIGEYHCIQRVGYEQASASIYYPTSEVDYNTVYINQDNVLITDSGDFTRENIIQHIYEKINGFEFYCMSTSKCEIYQDCIAGDIINTSVINDKFLATAKGQILANALGQKLIARIKTSIPTIAQIDWSYNAKWNGGYDLDVDTDVQEETQIVSSTEKKIKSLKITVDRDLGLIKQEVSDVNEKVDDVSTELTTKYSTTEQTSNAITLAVNESKTQIENDVANTYATKASLSIYVKEEDAPSKVASWIEASADNIIIKYSNSLIFGDYPDGQYMQARTNDSNNGVLFKGTGTFELDSVGDFNLINYADSNYSKFKNKIYTRTYQSDEDYGQSLELYNNQYDYDITANFLQLFGGQNFNSVHIRNNALGGSYNTNVLSLKSYTDTRYSEISNYKDISTYANRLYLGKGSLDNLTYLSNFAFNTNNLANRLNMSSSSNSNGLLLENYYNTGTLFGRSNYLYMLSTSSESYLDLNNYAPTRSGTYNRITMSASSDGTTSLQIFNSSKCNLSFHNNESIELKCGGILVLNVDEGINLKTFVATNTSISSTTLTKNVYWCRYNLVQNSDYVLIGR